MVRSRFTSPSLPRTNWQWGSDDERLATYSTVAPIMNWERFTDTMFDPIPGEHVGIIGSTGQGKTTLMNRVLPMFPFTAVFGTKNNDATMDVLIERYSYMKMPHWRQISAKDVPRRVIWPPSGKLKEIVPTQQKVFSDAFDHIWAEGGRPKKNPVGWAVGIDELWWFTQVLKLDLYIRILFQQGRSSGISLIAATQRPAWVPTEMYSAPTHLFFFQESDDANLARIGEIDGGNKALVRSLVTNLSHHQVLYINNRRGIMARTSAPRFD